MTNAGRILVALYAQHAINAQQFINGQRKLSRSVIKTIIEEVARIMNGKGYSATNVLQSEQMLANAIKEMVIEQLQELAGKMKDQQDDLLKYELDWEHEQISLLIAASGEKPVKPKISEARELVKFDVMQIGNNLSATRKQYLNSMIVNQANAISSSAMLSMQAARGQSKRQVAAVVADDVEVFVKKTTANEIEKRVTTISTHVQTIARQSFGVANKKIMNGYLFAGVIDSLTSRQCRALDGRVVAADDKNLKFWRPPLHPNCRSTLIPNIYSDLIDGKPRLPKSRQSAFTVGGETRPKVDRTGDVYLQAIAKLPKKDRQKVLGVTMEEAFSKMDYQTFARQSLDKKNRPLPIKELKLRDNELGRVLREILGE